MARFSRRGFLPAPLRFRHFALFVAALLFAQLLFARHCARLLFAQLALAHFAARIPFTKLALPLRSPRALVRGELQVVQLGLQLLGPFPLPARLVSLVL